MEWSGVEWSGVEWSGVSGPDGHGPMALGGTEAPHPRVLARVLPHDTSNARNWQVMAGEVSVGVGVLRHGGYMYVSKMRGGTWSHSLLYLEQLELLFEKLVQTPSYIQLE